MEPLFLPWGERTFHKLLNLLNLLQQIKEDFAIIRIAQATKS